MTPEFNLYHPNFAVGFGVAPERVEPIAEAGSDAVIEWVSKPEGGLAQEVMMIGSRGVPDFHPESAWLGYTVAERFHGAIDPRRVLVQAHPEVKFNHNAPTFDKGLVPDYHRQREIVDRADQQIWERPAWSTESQDFEGILRDIEPPVTLKERVPARFMRKCTLGMRSNRILIDFGST